MESRPRGLLRDGCVAKYDLTINLTERVSIFGGASLIYINNVATSTRTLGGLRVDNQTGDLAFEPAIYTGARFGLNFEF